MTDSPAEFWIVTHGLRWVTRNVGGSFAYTFQALQQEHMNTVTGERQWLDVPLVELTQQEKS